MVRPKRQTIGENTLRDSAVSNQVTCTIHGYGFQKMEVLRGDKIVPVCGECLRSGVGTMPEPDWLDPFCTQAGVDCTGVVGANRCRKCHQCKCDNHMLINGPLGICRDCKTEADRFAAVASVSRQDSKSELCSSDTCVEFVTDYCKSCEAGYCRACMHGAHDDGICRHCAGMFGADLVGRGHS